MAPGSILHQRTYHYPMHDLYELSQHLRELEEALLLPDVRKSKRLGELIADDFVEFGSSGRTYTKPDLVEALQTEAPVRQTAADFRVSVLAKDVALLTYRTHRHSIPPLRTLRSSVWRLRDCQWQMIFHQATPTFTTVMRMANVRWTRRAVRGLALYARWCGRARCAPRRGANGPGQPEIKVRRSVAIRGSYYWSRTTTPNRSWGDHFGDPGGIEGTKM
jgi:glyoxylase I family protein